MTSAQVATTLLLVAAQLLAFKLTQYALPQFYFTTSSLFESRREVAGAAILVRLAIPLTAGFLAELVAETDEFKIAAVAGAATWLLVIWPVVWNPSLLPHSKRWPIAALLAGFWAAFALLPIGGAASASMLLELSTDGEIDWGSEFVTAVVTSLPITAIVILLGHAARANVSFADDEEPDTAADDEYIEGDEAAAPPFALPQILLPLAAVALVLLAFRAGRRSRN